MTSILIGSSFALAGMAVLCLQLASYDGWRAWKALSDEIHALLGHDTKIFPDHSHD